MEVNKASADRAKGLVPGKGKDNSNHRQALEGAEEAVEALIKGETLVAAAVEAEGEEGAETGERGAKEGAIHIVPFNCNEVKPFAS